MIQALETNFQKHSEEQFARFMARLDEQVARLDDRVNQLQSSSSKPQVVNGTASSGMVSPPGQRPEATIDSRDVNSILKIMRVKVHRFDGTNVEDWVYKINKFFDLHGVLPDIRLAMVAFHLEGAPSTWFQWMEKGGGFSDWESFLRALRLRFGVSIYDDPLGRIAKLVRTGRVSTFRAEFEALMTQISGVSEQYFLNFFVWGLKNEIRRELLMAKPVDLVDAMAKAQLFEDRHDDLLGRAHGESGRSGWSPKFPKSSAPAAQNEAGSASVGSTSNVTAASKFQTLNNTSLPVKRLSPAEIKEKREKGLCFTCDEKYSFGHKCKNRVLILCAQGEEEEEEDTPAGVEELAELDDSQADEVSLNSLSNSTNPRIFRIMAHHGKEPLEVLIDTGSNNNFIQEALAARLGLNCEVTKRFKVYMGNGNSLWCSQLCKGVELVLQGHKFLVDLYILPIWGLNVVLGMQWLQTLGPCIHDHKALTMEFQWQGAVVKLAGSSNLANHQLSFTQLRSLVREGDVRELFKLAAGCEQQDNSVLEMAEIEATLPMAAKGILTEFSDVFAEPTHLPPHRGTDHRICLQPGTSPPTCYSLPELSINNKPVMVPQAILATRLVGNNDHKKPQVLVQWSLSAPEDATWEDFQEFCQLYDLTNLEDKVVFEEGSSVSPNPNQKSGPITLDPNQIQDKMEGWFDESTAGVEPSPLRETKEGSKKEWKSHTSKGGRVRTRATRVRVRPR
ncbi:uncharacterized protein LOC133814394 [Humulus lupulus]|uniref:uncharacterized protein LOC133814394 n=1 Tax=Humulus lupulus TaxID=3486 RepID=UPI002B400D1B|nr:uncharacterized protein LOC133814394 [Humulus lupulus]